MVAVSSNVAQVRPSALVARIRQNREPLAAV
jgi:hypothetical protein